MLVGYIRTSTQDQIAGFEDQRRLLVATGCTEKIFEEQISSVAERPQLRAALEFVREGDTLCVTKLDRLARSTTDLLNIISTLEGKGVALRINDFGGQPVDTKSSTGRRMLTLIGAFAQHERELLHERMRVGIARAKSLGKYKGRAPTAQRKAAQVRSLRASGMPAREVAKQLGMSIASTYRILADQSR